MKALKLVDVYDCFENAPISIENIDQYYVDVDKGRGLTPLKKMERLFERKPGGSYKFLFAGYKGCGKSTELDLRNNLTILGYNGEHWSDVHPVVMDILKERGKI